MGNIITEQRRNHARFPFSKKFRFVFTEISSGEWNSIFLNLRTTLKGMPIFSEINYREFPFHLVALQKFPEFSVKWFAFRKFNNF